MAWTPGNKEIKMAAKPLPQDGSFCRWLCGPGDKGKMADKPPPPSHVVEREDQVKNRTTQQSNFRSHKTPSSSKQQTTGNKDKSKGNLESKTSQALPRCLLHTTQQGLSQLCQLWTRSVNFSVTFWPTGPSWCCAAVLSHYHVVGRGGEKELHRAPKPAALTPPVPVSAHRQVFVNFALKQFRIAKCSFLEACTRQGV